MEDEGGIILLFAALLILGPPILWLILKLAGVH